MSSTILNADTRLQEDVMTEIAYDPAISCTDIMATVSGDGLVRLEGHADSYSSELAAVNAAWRVYGVVDVIDAIKIDSKMKSRNDGDIENDIKDRLDKDFLIPKNNVMVSVIDGVATLSGKVNFHIEREAAREEAADTIGVRWVENKITINQNSPSATGIAADIKKAFIRSAQVDAENIHIDTQEGHVTLSGHSSSYSERQEAYAAAWRSKGVTNVTNNVVIRPH
jgi:osmotically-inducible protein OsmY